MSRPRIRAPRALAVLLALVAAGSTLTSCSQESTGAKGYISGTGVITRLDADQRKAPREVEGETLDGETWRLSDHRGEVVVVNVWGSWCPPCRKEAADLVEASQELDDVEFVGINVRDSEAGARSFERRFEVPYPSLYDPSGRTLLAFRGTLPPNAIPSTVVVDADGKVAALILGQLPSSRTLVDLVEDVESS